MSPKERAQKLRDERSYECGLLVIENMMLYYIGIAQTELEEYWNQVLTHYENI